MKFFFYLVSYLSDVKELRKDLQIFKHDILADLIEKFRSLRDQQNSLQKDVDDIKDMLKI